MFVSNSRPGCHTAFIGIATRISESVLLGVRVQMLTNEDFRFKAHHYLLDLEATNNHLMLLVVAGEVTGKIWDDALTKQKCSYAAWLEAVDANEVSGAPLS